MIYLSLCGKGVIMFKSRMDMLQYNYKVIANSFYGNTGTPASRFYFPPIAMSITLFGQEMIKRCKEILSENGYEILYSDTDSTFINVDNQIPKELKERNNDEEIIKYIYEKIVPKLYEIINPELDKLAQEYGIENHRFAMKQEIVGKRLIFFFRRNRKEDEILSAKKRYIAWIVDEEGDKTDKLLVRGLEIRRSELSKDIKDRVKEIYEYVLKTEDNEEQIKENIITRSLELKKDILSWIRNLDIEKFAININIKDISDYRGNTPQYKGLYYYNIIAEIYNLPKVVSVIKGKLIYIKLQKNPQKSPIFDYVIQNKPKIYNPSKGKEEVIYPQKFDSLVISPEIAHLIPSDIWNEIKINEDGMLDRVFYGPLTPLFDLFNISRDDLIFK